MQRSLDIAIVGYGIAGIAAAIHLQRLGHRITHFDRNNPPAACGAGMLLHPPALRQLDQLGVLAGAIACGAPVKRICARTVHGRTLMDFAYGDLVSAQYGLGIQRGALHRLLSSADAGQSEVCAGCSVIAVEPGTGYLKEEGNTRRGPFDLVVIADGAHSLLRKEFSPFVLRDRLAESAALVGLLDDPTGLAGDCLAQYFDSTRHVSVWPVGCSSTGESPRCGFAINVARSEAEAFRDQGAWRLLVRRLCSTLRPLIKDAVENSDLHIFTYRDVELTQSYVGRVAIIGDAAHSMSPQLGVGAQLAMEDAALLAGEIERHTDMHDALRAYERMRTPQLRRIQFASRCLTPLFQSETKMIAYLRDHLLAYASRLPSVRQGAHALIG